MTLISLKNYEIIRLKKMELNIIINNNELGVFTSLSI